MVFFAVPTIRFEKEPGRISKGFDAIVGKVGSELVSTDVADMEHDDESESEEFEEDDNDDDEDSDSDDMKDNDIEEESEDYGSGEELEDKFLKIKELEKYLKEDEEREYGLKAKRKKAGGKKASKDDDESEVGEDDNEDEDDQLGLFEEGDEDDELESARYEDFFVSNKKEPEKKRKQIDRSDDWNAEDEQEDIEIDGSDDSDAEDLQVDNENDESDDSDAEDDLEDNQKEGKLSKHEMEQKKLQAKIKEMEKANLDTKTWTMQGEVTAAKRPLNSALEVDLDFEHNVRPAPVITEEVTASVEEIIKKRVVEGRFDGAQRAPKLPSKAPREFKELDENKSKRGLADLYEEEYMEKTGLAPASLSFSDELKKEANILFKRLIFKLNALSHFHFAPKPVVEDMTIETNLPALAMEEVAPVAVSDAAMLAPEEVFAGKGDVKEETELTQEDKKRRRAKKKRKFKAEQSKRMAKKLKETPVITQGEGKVTVVKA